MEATINSAFKAYKRSAMLLEREEGIRYDAKPRKEIVGKMLDGFCKAMDNGDERRKDLYSAGLMLSLWYKIKRLAEQSPALGLELEDYMSWIFEAIMYACKYRKWQKDPSVNAQQCLMQCVETIRLQHYYTCNLDNAKANYLCASFDTPQSDDSKYCMEEITADDAEIERSDAAKSADYAKAVVQALVDQKKLVEAVIMDVIAFGDARKIRKKTSTSVGEDGKKVKRVSYESEFWPFKCVQLINALPEGYFDYFMSMYKPSAPEFAAAFASIKSAPNAKLYKSIKSAQASAKAVIRAM